MHGATTAVWRLSHPRHPSPPARDTKMLTDNGTIMKTQSAVVLEKLIGQFLYDKAASNGAGK